MTAPATRTRAWAPAVTVIVVALVAAAACGWLGVWQWERAHARATFAASAPPVPIGAVLAPSSDSTDALGRSVSVTGTYGDDSAVVWGIDVDGAPSVLLVRSLIVSADQTETGRPATLAVLVGHRPAGDAACPDPSVGMVTVTGYLAVSEAARDASRGAPTPDVCGARGTGVVSAAELAQTWPGPMYSAILVADTGSATWEAMPPRPPATRLNLQSLAYAAEWWAFAVFALVLAGRWVRDNGREPTSGSDT